MTLIELKTDAGIDVMSIEEFERRVRDGDVPPSAPIRFSVLTGKRFVPVGELEFYHALADPDDHAFREGLKHIGLPIVTTGLVGVQIRIYLWSKAPQVSELLIDQSTNWAPGVLEAGQVYRLLSYGFLHLGFTHLTLNMLFLAYTGWNLERSMGRRNLLTLYLASVFFGGLLSTLMSPGRPSLGASGGDFGLMAAAVVVGWKYADQLPETARKYFGWSILGYLVVLGGMGLSSPNVVDNWGHLGGMLGGGAMATWLQPEVYRRNRKRNRWIRGWSGALGTLICGLLIWRGPDLIPLEPVSDQGLEASRPAYWNPGWSFTGDRGWESPTGAAHYVIRAGTDRPQSPEEAVDFLMELVDYEGNDARLISDEPTEVDGWPARRLRITYWDLGVKQVMEALVITRGAYVHRLYLHARAERGRVYRKLADRMFATVELHDPPDLEEARQRTLQHPRSWQVAMERGRAAQLAGYPEESARSYKHAYSLSKTPERQARAAAAQLRLRSAYQLDTSPDLIDELVIANRDAIEVLLAAAELYYQAGLPDDGQAMLDEARAKGPEDFSVQRAREAHGLE